MPTVDQNLGTLPHIFRSKYPQTYAIIDDSEIFLQTPSDLHMQSSTWSQYKYHNAAKLLMASTPNSAICCVSSVFVGSISIELTRVLGFLTKLEGKPGIAIKADRGFTIQDMLKQLNIWLNLPPFMEGKQQLPAQSVWSGRSIASHWERYRKGEIFHHTKRNNTNQPISYCMCLFLPFKFFPHPYTITT